jgi:Exoribonuclease 1 Domain-3
MAKASTVFPSEDDPCAKAKEIRAWLATKGVRDFEPVSLLCDQLEKVCPRPVQVWAGR